MNKQILLNAADHIEKNWASFDWLDWCSEGPCGTRGCIAYHIMLGNGKRWPKEAGSLKAQQLADLDIGQRLRLFYGHADIPVSHLRDLAGTKKLAKAAAKYIRDFVEREGK